LAHARAEDYERTHRRVELVSDSAETRASAPARVLGWPLVITKKVARVIPEAVHRFFADQGPQQAAEIAYRVLFSIAPLAIELVSIFGLVLQDDSIRHDVVNSIVDALPVSEAGRKDVENAITAIATPASAAGLVGLLVFVWAATGMMTAIRRGLESAMDVAESRPAAYASATGLRERSSPPSSSCSSRLPPAGSARGRRGSASSTARSQRRSSFSTPCISTRRPCSSVPR